MSLSLSLSVSLLFSANSLCCYSNKLLISLLALLTPMHIHSTGQSINVSRDSRTVMLNRVFKIAIDS